MIDIFWVIMTRLFSLLVPLTSIYIMFDFLGSLVFNKR